MCIDLFTALLQDLLIAKEATVLAESRVLDEIATRAEVRVWGVGVVSLYHAQFNCSSPPYIYSLDVYYVLYICMYMMYVYVYALLTRSTF